MKLPWRTGDETDRDGKRLSLVEIFLPVDSAVVARGHVERESVAVMDHDAITAQIDPVFVRIPADGNVESPDVSPAIALVPKWNRQRKQIDVFSFENVFHQRTRVHHARPMKLGMVEALLPGVHELLAEDDVLLQYAVGPDHDVDGAAAPQGCRIDPPRLAADGGIRLWSDRAQFPSRRGA